MSSPGEERRNTLLSTVTIVLVRPQSPGNVGAAARIVRNFGLAGMSIVTDSSQRADQMVSNPEAVRFAHQSEHVLLAAEAFPSLRDALAPHHWSVAATGRCGRERGEPPQIRNVASHLAWKAQTAPGAIVFGPESDGLNETEIRLCNHIVRIPQYRPGPALNLAQSVAVIASELCSAALTPAPRAHSEGAPAESKHRLVRRMSRMARHCGLALRNRPEEMPEALARVILGHDFDAVDIATLERWLSQIEWFTGITPAKSWDEV